MISIAYAGSKVLQPSVGFSVIATIYAWDIQQRTPSFSMIDSQAVVWSWMSLFMGIYIAFKLKKWTEILFGILFFALCLVPIVGMFLGIGYFAWSYVKLERSKLPVRRVPYHLNSQSGNGAAERH